MRKPIQAVEINGEKKINDLEISQKEIERLKELLRECIQNVYYSESACPPSWLKEAQEASKTTCRSETERNEQC